MGNQKKADAISSKINIYLTKSDEYCPKTHIGMYPLLRNKKNVSAYLSEEDCQKMRKDTFQNVLDMFKKYGSPDYADFFNYNAEVIAEIGMNHFSFHPKLSPVCLLIECFSFPCINHAGEKSQAISFGINRELLQQYLKSYAEAQKKGTLVDIPKLVRKPPEKRDLILYGEARIDIGGGNTFKTARNALYNRFLDWCDIQGISEQEGAAMALETVLQAYPSERLKDISEYDLITEFDRPLFALPKREYRDTEETIVVSGTIRGISKKIIERYNRDPDNIAKPKLTFDKYVNNALFLMNNSIGLKYRNPGLYFEKLQLEEMERYNELNKQRKS